MLYSVIQDKHSLTSVYFDFVQLQQQTLITAVDLVSLHCQVSVPDLQLLCLQRAVHQESHQLLVVGGICAQ